MKIFKRQPARSRVDHLEQMIPYVVALGCARAWVTLVFAAPGAYVQFDGFNPHILFDYVYAGVGVAVALAARHISPLQEEAWSKPLSLGSMLASAACVVAAAYFPEARSVLIVLFAGFGAIGFCLLGLLNSEALVSLNLVRIALCIAGARLFAVSLVFFCDGLDDMRLRLAIVLLPVISVACVSFAYSTTPVSERPKRSYPKFTFPWKPIALMSAFSFAYGMSESRFSTGVGMHSTLSTALIMAIFVLVVYFFSDRFSISALYRSPLMLLACGALLIPAEGLLGDVVAGYLISMSYTFMSLLVSLLFYDLSKRMGIAIVVMVGMSKVAKLFTIWGNDLSRYLGGIEVLGQMRDPIVLGVIVAVVLIGILILLSEKELASTWGVRARQTGGLAEESRLEEVLAQRCSEMTRQYHLSPREDEVLRLLANGKTNAAIERELVIANGTLKAHIQHIYVKTDVHSRKELLEMILPKQKAEADSAPGEARG